MNQVTIVMYHYVRPIRGSVYPGIKGLELDAFRRQLDYLSERYTFITASDMVSAVKDGCSLPKNACWLTFDDGYKDHILYVMPELLRRGIQGAFFPPVEPVINRTMLDVNSVHYILASVKDAGILVRDLNDLCLSYDISYETINSSWEKYARPSRYDIKEVMYFKNMLQHALPKKIRNDITSIIFGKYVAADQKDFANSLYLSTDDVKELIGAGMHVGSHGYSHFWMSQESVDSQLREIKQSTDFLGSIGVNTSEWIMCYPYGAYNEDTISLLSKMGCVLGLTTEVAKADLSHHHHLKLPRFDTNDFPQ